jgi:SAM-dependent methyltransferase
MRAGNRIFSDIIKSLSRPELYAPSSGSFWDDPYISEIMLDVHLDPESDSATRRHDFVDKSVAWISEIAPPSAYPNLLDLGCGPGIYAEKFHHSGYTVTGIDFSERSIRYAEVQAVLSKTDIEYLHQDYLTIGYTDRFDIVTLIYCDYAVLSATDRCALLGKIFQALKPGGKFIFDVFTHKMRKEVSQSWYYSENGGLFTEVPHVCLNAVYQYEDADRTELRQSVVITERSVRCFNIWDHFFSRDEIINEVKPIGFSGYEIFGDIAGSEYTESGETICCVLTK